MIKYVQGDLLTSSADLICHQVNCCGLMGSGIAKQIRDKYPDTYKEYKTICNTFPDMKKHMLGKVLLSEIGEGQAIAHLFGQIVPSTVGVQTDYRGLATAMRRIRSLCTTETIAFPYGIGCGLAGGDWTIVSKIIETAFDGYKGTVEIWRLNNDEGIQTVSAG